MLSKWRGRIGCFVTVVLFCTASIWANSAPVVSNVSVSLRTGSSGTVDIYYTLSDADGDNCTISVAVSNDGGSSWTITPSALSGDLINVSPGRRHIIWNSKTDLPGVFGTNYRIKVTAYDGSGPDGMVWVYINDSGAGMKDESGNPISHGGFTGEMSKYETTNAQYCQYLNAAKASNDITVSGSYVTGTSGPYSGQNYYYLAGPGYTGGGATNGGAARINWTGSSFTVDSGFDNHPVTYVNWYGSTAFASYYGWRLPTEWEWQAVADYNGSYTYGCGSSLYDAQKFLANYRSNGDNSYAPNDLPYHPWVVHGTSEVGHFGTFGYGMCDMAGNVWEWTSTVSSSSRVTRGGGWADLDYNCTVSRRINRDPDLATNGVGFLVCR